MVVFSGETVNFGLHVFKELINRYFLYYRVYKLSTVHRFSRLMCGGDVRCTSQAKWMDERGYS